MTARKLDLLNQRIDEAYRILESCTLCPRDCKVNRMKGEKGACRLGRELAVSTMSIHHGEEPPVSGTRGSGTVFFSSCNLRCVFCQNHPISHMMRGDTMTPETLAGSMLRLQDSGAHNINLVTPTHLVPQIMSSLIIAVEKGLSIPILYNTGGYDALPTLALLDGIVDIYMPDMKYADPQVGKKLSSVPDYPQRNQSAVVEMHRQVGDLVIDDRNIATRGLLVRHLVLPNDLAGTAAVMKFIAAHLSKHTCISLMSQYFPDHRAHEFPELSRRLTRKEYARARRAMEDAGLHNGWVQDLAPDIERFNIRRFLDDGE